LLIETPAIVHVEAVFELQIVSLGDPICDGRCRVDPFL